MTKSIILLAFVSVVSASQITIITDSITDSIDSKISSIYETINFDLGIKLEDGKAIEHINYLMNSPKKDTVISLLVTAKTLEIEMVKHLNNVYPEYRQNWIVTKRYLTKERTLLVEQLHTKDTITIEYTGKLNLN